MPNNPNLDLVKINAYAKFGLIPSIRSQDIEGKRGRNDRMMKSQTSSKQYTLHTSYAGHMTRLDIPCHVDWQTIHMKYKALYSLKNKYNYFRMLSAAVVIDTFRVKT